MMCEQIVDGSNREIARVLTFADDVSRSDARALDDPLVAGLDHHFEVGVGEDAARRVHAERGDSRGRGNDHNPSTTACANSRVESTRSPARASSTVRAPRAYADSTARSMRAA